MNNTKGPILLLFRATIGIPEKLKIFFAENLVIVIQFFPKKRNKLKLGLLRKIKMPPAILQKTEI